MNALKMQNLTCYDIFSGMPVCCDASVSQLHLAWGRLWSTIWELLTAVVGILYMVFRNFDILHIFQNILVRTLFYQKTQYLRESNGAWKRHFEVDLIVTRE